MSIRSKAVAFQIEKEHPSGKGNTVPGEAPYMSAAYSNLRNIQPRGFLISLAAAVLFAFGLASVSIARAENTAQFDLPAQPLEMTLRALGDRLDTNILFDPRQVRDVMAPALKGTVGIEEALRKLLAGTRIEYRVMDERTISLVQVGVGVGEKMTATASDHGTMRLVQNDSSSTYSSDQETSSRSSEKKDESEEEGLENSVREGIPEILVTGSKVGTLNMDIRRTEDDAQPYVLFDREAIENSGFGSLQDFFKHSLTMSTTESGPAQESDSIFGNTSSINLRGLGSDETLILVDGHRIASINSSLVAGAIQPDINGIPLSAIERIEVLPTTASGLYGGGATGGVINIVLRRDYSGLDLKMTYGNTFESDVASRRIDLSAGQALWGGKTTLLFAGSFADSNELLTRERDFAQRGREHILAHNPASLYESRRPPLGSMPNIRSATGSDLTLKDGTPLNSQITFIPPGYAGTSADGGAVLVENAGNYNLELANTAQSGGGQLGTLLTRPISKSAMLTIRQEFTSNIQAFVELDTYENSGRSAVSAVSISERISASAPNNPFQQDVFVTVPAIGTDGHVESESKNRKVIAGIIGKLPRGWQMEADFTWNKTGYSFENTAGLLPESTRANIGSGALDVLLDVNQFGLDLGQLDANASSPQANTILKDSTLRFAGPLPLRVPGGNLTVTSLLEHREESYGEHIVRSSLLTQVRPSQSQSVNSLYVEASLPIVAASNRLRGVDELELQVAVRRDVYQNWVSPEPTTRFRTELTSMDPTIGLRYKPSSDVMFRASFGTGFLPPSAIQLTPEPPFPVLGSLDLTDPLRGSEPIVSGDIFFGGNSGLRPEESKSKSVGAILTPRWMPKSRLSIDWSRTEKTDNITGVATLSQTDLENEALVPGLIVRGPRADGDPFPVGPVVALNAGLFNIARFRVDALDLAFGYEFEVARAGSFDVSIRATYLDTLETQLTPAADVVENAGVSGWGLKWRSNGSVAWRRGGWTLGWVTRFFDAYFVNENRTVNPNQGSATVPSQTYHDVFGRYALSAVGFWANTELQFGASNVFNKHPPVDVSRGSVTRSYSQWGDPRLANYYVSFRKMFGN